MEKPSLDTAKAGAMRFNTDSSQMEIYDGNQWIGVLSTSSFLQTGGTRGIVFGEESNTSDIEFYNLDTTGDAVDFADMTRTGTVSPAAFASRVRGIATGGGPSSPTNIIEFITIAHQANAQDFGDLTRAHRNAGGGSSETRGLTIGGYVNPNTVNTIDYVTIASTGNAVDFGDATDTVEGQFPTVNSPTRIVYGQYGTDPGTPMTIEYVTTSTLGNAADFGSVTGDTRSSGGGGGNAVRGVFGGGAAPNQPSYTPQDEIHFITIATLGNSIDFGNLNDAVSNCSACSSPTRVVFNGGYTPSQTNQLQYIQTMTTGNALDFGDLTSNKARTSGCSNGHGGL